MKLLDEHIETIKKDFASMQAKEDFLRLLNFVKGILYADKCIPFEERQLNYHIQPRLNAHRYRQFNVLKKSGGERTICAPCSGLKEIQCCLNVVFQAIYTPHKNAYGFVPEKSIVDNARKHVGNIYIYNIDLKDFFPSIDQARIWGRLHYHPFNLDKKHDREKIANMIAVLCCHEMEVERLNESGVWETVTKRVLPQGAPTSPILTNIICERLDYLLSAVAKRFGLKYSRYADDITFSSMHNVYQKDSEFINELQRIIKEQGFSVKHSKTRLQKAGFKQVVTGLTVSDRVNVHQRYVKQLRKWLYYWETYGHERAAEYFLPKYNEDKGHAKKGNPSMENVLSGKLEFLKMVKGAENPTYLKLKERFDKLTNVIVDIPTIIAEPPLEYQNKESKEIIFPITFSEVNYPVMHNAPRLVELLKGFSENDKALKYTTHSWEYGKFVSYEDFMDKIFVEWQIISKELINLNKQLNAKISNFLFNKELGSKKVDSKFFISWGEKRLKFGWSSPALKEYMSLPDKYPFACSIPYEIRELDKQHSLLYFKDYVSVFKNEIEIREDNNTLEKLFNDLWQNTLSYDFNLEQENVRGISFFTDVAYFRSAMELTLKMCASRPQYPKILVIVEPYFESKYILLKIIQKESECQRDIDDPKICKPSGGDLATIINKVNNLADFSIVSNFYKNKKTFRINYITSFENVPHIEELNHSCEGFTYEFKFFI